MTSLSFTKMHGLGNDFVMLSGPEAIPAGVSPQLLAATLCDRHFGIGADGLIYPDQASSPEQGDIKFVYINSDGSMAEMCGNGIRCFALYVQDQGLIKTDAFTAETLAGPIKPRINADRTVTVDMGAPILEAERIPFVSGNGIGPADTVREYPLSVLDQKVAITTVSMGNPHCLVFEPGLDPAVYGPALEKHPGFPAKTNVEFIEVLDRNRMKVVVWERGCGFTLACGTGACASAVAGQLLGKTDQKVTVELPGGNLDIEWNGETTAPVFMTGPAEYAFTGTFELTPEKLARGQAILSR